jgi:hypothetical protein
VTFPYNDDGVFQAASPIAMGGWPMTGHDVSRAANASAILPSAPRMLAPTTPPTGFSFKVASPLVGFLNVETSTDLAVGLDVSPCEGDGAC